jgi:hypothetical protein
MEINASALIKVDARLVVLEPLALKDRHERAIITEVKVVLDGAFLVLTDAQSGLLKHPGFAHPVHWCRPLQPADLRFVAVNSASTYSGTVVRHSPYVELREATGVERPFSPGDVEASCTSFKRR